MSVAQPDVAQVAKAHGPTEPRWPKHARSEGRFKSSAGEKNDNNNN